MRWYEVGGWLRIALLVSIQGAVNGSEKGVFRGSGKGRIAFASDFSFLFK